jgi:hypothetical protein
MTQAKRAQKTKIYPKHPLPDSPLDDALAHPDPVASEPVLVGIPFLNILAYQHLLDAIDYDSIDWTTPAPHCLQCATPWAVGIFPVGRPPVYCSNACKMKAYRSRLAVTKLNCTVTAVTKRRRQSSAVTESAARFQS